MALCWVRLLQLFQGDNTIMDVAMGIDTTHKMIGGRCIEKHILREAFKGVLPNEILWRRPVEGEDEYSDHHPSNKNPVYGKDKEWYRNEQ